MEIELEIEHKKRAAACVIIIVLCVGYTVINLIRDKPAPVHQESSIQQTQQQSAVAKSEKQPVKIAATAGTDLDVMLKTNPFVDVSEMHKLQNTNGSGTPSAPVIPAVHQMQGSLPAIPSANLPSVPVPANIPVPAIPNNPGNPINTSEHPPASVQNDTVQGVMTGNDGSSMAIMGNGQIVQEGDTYNDGRISYIGGDGIKFDDGRHIDYK